MRAFINIIEGEQTGLYAVTAQQVIAYARNPVNADVHAVYEEQIDYAFDGSRDALDQWLLEMTGDVKAKIAGMIRKNKIMYRGFTGRAREPLGIHWTTAPYIAAEFASKGDIIEAYIDPNIVDWLGTVVRGIFWDNTDEDELFLIKGSAVTLTNGKIARI